MGAITWARNPMETAVAILLAASLVPGALELPVDLAVALIVGCACLVALLDGAMWWRRTVTGRTLADAIGAIRRDEDHYGVAERVRGLELRGRPRLRRDAALRCLVEAGRCRRLDRRLRGAEDELRKELGR